MIVHRGTVSWQRALLGGQMMMNRGGGGGVTETLAGTAATDHNVGSLT